MDINTYIKEVDRNYTTDFQSFKKFMINKYERIKKTKNTTKSICNDVQQFTDALVKEGSINIEIKDSLTNFLMGYFYIRE